MFNEKLQYILPWCRKKSEDATVVETQTKHISELVVHYRQGNTVVRHSYSSDYDPEVQNDHIKKYEDILNWFTKPAKQKSQTFTLHYHEGARVFVRENILSIEIAKHIKQVTVETAKKQ